MNNKCIADDSYILADDKLRKALDSIVIELNVHGTGLDDQRFIEWHCDDDLRQRYGDKQLIEMAHRRFGSCSPMLSEKAAQWYHQFNDEYFGGRLEPICVFAHYGHEMGRPLADHNEYDTLNIYVIVAGDDLRGNREGLQENQTHGGRSTEGYGSVVP